MLQAMNILEGMNVRYMRHNSAPYLHAVTEALKLSFADRNRWVGDPKFVPPIPMRELLSKEYAAARRALINPDRAIEGEAPAGRSRDSARPASRSPGRARSRRPISPRRRPPSRTATRRISRSSTRTATWCRSPRRSSASSAAATSSKAPGFILNNRMAYFGLEADDVNVLQAGQARAADDQSAAGAEGRQAVHGVRHAGRRHAAAGAAAVLPQRRRVRDERAAGARAAVDRQHRLPQLVLPARRGRARCRFPRVLPKHVLDELAAMGHKLDIRNVRGVGSVKAIIIHPKTGVLMGGVSPTRDSYVMAY